jgi:Peptidase inhibitor family I36
LSKVCASWHLYNPAFNRLALRTARTRQKGVNMRGTIRSMLAIVGVVAALVVIPTATAAAKQSVVLPFGGLALGDHVIYDGGGSGYAAGISSFGSCTDGRFCLWTGQDFTGTMFYKTTNGWSNISVYPNQAESARNNTDRTGYVATGINGGGSRQTHNPRGHFVSLGPTFNNDVESYCLYTPTC